MSETLSSVVSLYTGGAITLGDFVFQGFECPAKISYGGSQAITVHKLPGGARVIDDVGDDPVPITWSGLLFGPGAQQRRDQLQAMRLRGDLVELAFDDQNFLVKLRETAFEMQGISRVEYRITCEVMPDIAGDDSDDADFGDGAPPTTEVAAKDEGQATLTNARKVSSTIPVPPIPPATPPT